MFDKVKVWMFPGSEGHHGMKKINAVAGQFDEWKKKLEHGQNLVWQKITGNLQKIEGIKEENKTLMDHHTKAQRLFQGLHALMTHDGGTNEAPKVEAGS